MCLLFKLREGGSDIREVSVVVGDVWWYLIFCFVVSAIDLLSCDGDEQSTAAGGWVMALVPRAKNTAPAILGGSRFIYL